MLDPKATPGVVPGPESTVQNDQPGNEPISPGNQPDSRLELLYSLSDVDRLAIMALPEAVREPAIAALHAGRVGYEEAMRTDLAAGRQAIEQVNVLMAEPTFAPYLRGELTPQEQPQGRPNPQPPPAPANNLTDRYGENASSYLEDMAQRAAAIVTEQIGGQFSGLSETVQNMQRGFARNDAEQNWTALVERTKAQGLPDPSATQSRIQMLMTQNPSLTLDQAYAATQDLSLLRPAPANAGGGAGGEENAGQPVTPPPVSQPPGMNANSSVPRTTLENVDHEEQAINNRKEGINLNPVTAIKNALLQGLADKNEADGTNITPDEL